MKEHFLNVSMLSFNGMGTSECNVDIQKIFNSSVHISFQVDVQSRRVIQLDRKIDIDR